MTDAAEPAEPIESTEQNEPTEPTDSTEPTEPTERIEPSLAIDRIEPLDTSERSELTLWTVDEPRGAYYGSACGLSHDRKTLVLIEPRRSFPRVNTKLLVLSTRNLGHANSCGAGWLFCDPAGTLTASGRGRRRTDRFERLVPRRV